MANMNGAYLNSDMAKKFTFKFRLSIDNIMELTTP